MCLSLYQDTCEKKIAITFIDQVIQRQIKGYYNWFVVTLDVLQCHKITIFYYPSYKWGAIKR